MSKPGTPREFDEDEDGGVQLGARAVRVKGARRQRTIARREMLRDRKKFQEDPEVLAEMDRLRPRQRRDCINAPRPCIFVGCSRHLYLDVNPQTGSIKLNFPDKEVWELPETCALDVADRGGVTLEEVGAILNLTRERIRQLEVAGLKQLQSHCGPNRDDPNFDGGRMERARRRNHGREEEFPPPPNGGPASVKEFGAALFASTARLKAAFAPSPAKPSVPASPAPPFPAPPAPPPVPSPRPAPSRPLSAANPRATTPTPVSGTDSRATSVSFTDFDLGI